MSLFDNSLPPAARTPDPRWEAYLSQNPAITHELMHYRYGYLGRTPLESARNIRNAEHIVAVPHPNQKNYSMIEDAKRRKEEVERHERTNQRVHIHGIEQRAPWIPPHEHPDLLRFRPNIRHFQNPKRFFRMPPW
jgi:hypothetical protein